MAMIEIKSMSKVYGLGEAMTVALDAVDLKIDKGEFVAIMGPSGSGKSTLMNLIGLLDTPSHGTYKLDGRSVGQLRGRARARIRREQIGFIFQSFNLLAKMNVIDNVALPLMYARMGVTERLKKASNILESLDMQEKEYYMPNQLSGGQLQRAAIARALANSPSIILADEPTGNLDSKNAIKIMEIMKDVHKKGNTIVMVTHDLDMAKFADRVIHMNDGQIVDKPAETTKKPRKKTKAKTKAKASTKKPKKKAKAKK